MFTLLILTHLLFGLSTPAQADELQSGLDNVAITQGADQGAQYGTDSDGYGYVIF